MMWLITSIAGAIYLTGLLFRLVDFIERPKRKAPCAHADQSKAQETVQHQPQGPGALIVPRPRRKYKEVHIEN